MLLPSTIGEFMSRLMVLLFLMPATIAFAKPKKTPDIINGLPNIRSTAALIVDFSTNEVLFEREPDTQRPIASISKLMGALVIHKYCQLKDEGMHTMTVANREAARGGDKSKLVTGWSYSHLDLLRAALMKSDNRALPALGEACGLDIPTFASKMNEEARLLGLTRTSFAEPNGLSRDNVSTPREIMVLLKAVIAIPKLAAIMSTKDAVITGHRDNKTRTVTIKNTDRMLSKDVATILGGKTGYTDLARYCLAIAARTDDGRELGMVFLGAEGKLTRFADFTRAIRWLLDGTKAYAGSTGTDGKAGPQDKSLPESQNKIPTEARSQPAEEIPGFKKDGAARNPKELFEYYW